MKTQRYIYKPIAYSGDTYQYQEIKICPRCGKLMPGYTDTAGFTPREHECNQVVSKKYSDWKNGREDGRVS